MSSAESFSLPRLPEPNPDLARLLCEAYDYLQIEVVHPVKDFDTGEIVDGRQRKYAHERKGVRSEPIGVRYPSEEHRRLHEIVLNITTRPLNEREARDLIRWSLGRGHAMTDRALARSIGKPNSSKLVAEVRGEMEGVGVLPQHDAREGPKGRLYKSRKSTPPKMLEVATTSEREFDALSQTFRDHGEHLSGLSGRATRRKINTLAHLAVREAYAKGAPETTPEGILISNQCFRHLILEPGSFDLGLLDGPWGEDWSEHRKEFAEKAFAALKDGGFALAYTGDNQFCEWLDVFRGVGFTLRWINVVLFEDGPDMRHDGRVQIQKTPVMVLQKGGIFRPPFLFRDTVPNGGREKRYHEWQQALAPMLEWTTKFTLPGGRVFDLTLCTGTSAVAVVKAGQGRTFVGCEIEELNVKIARRRVAEAFAEVV